MNSAECVNLVENQRISIFSIHYTRARKCGVTPQVVEKLIKPNSLYGVNS